VTTPRTGTTAQPDGARRFRCDFCSAWHTGYHRWPPDHPAAAWVYFISLWCGDCALAHGKVSVPDEPPSQADADYIVRRTALLVKSGMLASADVPAGEQTADPPPQEPPKSQPARARRGRGVVG